MINKKEYMKKYRENNKDNIKKQKRKWYEKNKSKTKEYNKKYRKDNNKKLNRNAKEYYHKIKDNLEYKKKRKKYKKRIKDKTKGYDKKYRENNRDILRERYKKFKKKYPEKVRKNNRKRRANKNNIVDVFSDKEWLQKLKDTFGICPRCNKYVGIHKLTLDHIHPISKAKQGQVYTIDDVQPLCRSWYASVVVGSHFIMHLPHL